MRTFKSFDSLPKALRPNPVSATAKVCHNQEVYGIVHVPLWNFRKIERERARRFNRFGKKAEFMPETVELVVSVSHQTGKKLVYEAS